MRKQVCKRCDAVFFAADPHDLCPVCELDPDGMLP
jgi:RNA polymerase subunit RPABC4/transcription elongation factor Spt4